MNNRPFVHQNLQNKELTKYIYYDPKPNLPSKWRVSSITDSLEKLGVIAGLDHEELVDGCGVFGPDKEWVASKLEEAAKEITPHNDTLNSNEIVEEEGAKVLIHSMGVYNDEKGKLRFNKDKFTVFLLDRINIISCTENPEELLLYNRKNGVYEVGNDGSLRRIILTYFFFAGFGKDIWSTGFEKDIIDRIKRLVSQKNYLEFNRRYFAFANLTLDTSNGEFVDHSPDHLLTIGNKDLMVNTEAKCPTFMNVLSQVMDEETQCFLAEYFAYSLMLNEFRGECFTIFYGTGSNAKSTISDQLANVIGIKNVSNVTMDSLSDSFGLQPLLGSAVNIAYENDGIIKSTSALKAISTGDAQSVNRKNLLEISTVITAKLLFLMNAEPIWTDASIGLERRTMVIPFTKQFLGDDQDNSLGNKLKQESAGVLNWIVEKGMKPLIARGISFKPSRTMIDFKKTLFAKLHPVESFVNTVTSPSEGSQVLSNEVVEIYRSWCMAQQIEPGSTSKSNIFWPIFESAYKDQYGRPVDRHKTRGRSTVFNISVQDNG